MEARHSSFYDSLSALEQAYWQRFVALFNLVEAQKPEKGIQALIVRARKAAGEGSIALEQALETEYENAKERTLRRMALLDKCQLPKSG